MDSLIDVTVLTFALEEDSVSFWAKDSNKVAAALTVNFSPWGRGSEELTEESVDGVEVELEEGWLSPPQDTKANKAAEAKVNNVDFCIIKTSK